MKTHSRIFFLLLMTSCATTPPPPPPSVPEQLRKDSQLGSHLTEKFESHLQFREDLEVSVYLRTIAERLVKFSPPLDGSPIGVRVVADRNAKWRNYALPGNRVYLSAGLLKRFEFENEVAAVISYELANILNRHVGRQLEERADLIERERQTQSNSLADSLLGENPSSVEFFGPSGVFAFSEKNYIESAHESVQIMYRAGYDPRGLVSLWQTYLEHSDQESPYERSTVQKILEATRDTYAQQTPLKNPTVRTESFLKIRPRIAKL